MIVRCYESHVDELGLFGSCAGRVSGLAVANWLECVAQAAICCGLLKTVPLEQVGVCRLGLFFLALVGSPRGHLVAVRCIWPTSWFFRLLSRMCASHNALVACVVGACVQLLNAL